MSVELVFHSTEVHWVCNDAGVAWSDHVVHRKSKETTCIFSKRQITYTRLKAKLTQIEI